MLPCYIHGTIFIVWDSISGRFFKFLPWTLPSIFFTTCSNRSSLVNAPDFSKLILISRLTFSLLWSSSSNLIRFFSGWGTIFSGTCTGINRIGGTNRGTVVGNGAKRLATGAITCGAAFATRWTAMGSPRETMKTRSVLKSFLLGSFSEIVLASDFARAFWRWVVINSKKPVWPSHLKPGLRFCNEVFSMRFKAWRTFAIS